MSCDLRHDGPVTSSTRLLRLLALLPGRPVWTGAELAERLGVTGAGRQVWLGGRWFTVVGILRPVTLAPELDRAALVGFPAAEALLGSDGSPGETLINSRRASSTSAARPSAPSAWIRSRR